MNRIRVLVLLALFSLLDQNALAQTLGSLENPIPMGQSASVGNISVSVTKYDDNAFGSDIGIFHTFIDGMGAPDKQVVVVWLLVENHGIETWSPISIDEEYVTSDRVVIGLSLLDSCTTTDTKQTYFGHILPGGRGEFAVCMPIESADIPGLMLYLTDDQDRATVFELNEAYSSN